MHNLATHKNKTVFISRHSGWHELGEITGRFMSFEEIATFEGLDYDVIKRQLGYWDETGGLMGSAAYHPVDSYGLFRSDNNAWIAPCSATYQVLQHKLGFKTMNEIVAASEGQAFFETAGALDKGQIVFGCINLTAVCPLNVKGDKHETYLVFSTSHDGSKAFEVWTSTVRVVCQNTLSAASASRELNGLKVYHTKNGEMKLLDGLKALHETQNDFKTYQERLNFLASRMMTPDGIKDVLKTVFQPRADKIAGVDAQTPVEYTQRGETRFRNLIDKVLQRYEWNDDNAFPEQRGTAYNLLQAITGYVDHDASTDDTKRAKSALFGLGNTRKQEALEVILLTADGMPVKSETKYFTAGGSDNSQVSGEVDLLDMIAGNTPR